MRDRMLHTPASLRAPLCAGLLLALQWSCVGTVDGDADQANAANPASAHKPTAGNPTTGSPTVDKPAAGKPTSNPATPASLTVGSRPLRRLTRTEYDNTIRDLLGDTSAPAATFPDDRRGPSGFETPTNVSIVEAGRFMDAAEKLAATALAKLPTLCRVTPPRLVRPSARVGSSTPSDAAPSGGH